MRQIEVNSVHPNAIVGDAVGDVGFEGGAFLLACMITAESLLVSAFGSLYTVYASYMTTGGAPICGVLRKLSYLLTLAIIAAAAVAIWTVFVLSSQQDTAIPVWALTTLAGIALSIPIVAVTLAHQQNKDA